MLADLWLIVNLLCYINSKHHNYYFHEHYQGTLLDNLCNFNTRLEGIGHCSQKMNNFQGLYTYVALYYLRRKADSVLKFHHLANWKVSIWKPAEGHEDMSVTGGYGECPLHLRELCAKWPLIDFLMWMSSFTPRGIFFF